MAYYGPFFQCRQMLGSKAAQGKNTPPPYHMVPILAFWALNTPVPQFPINADDNVRKNPANYPWGDISPENVFNNLMLYDLFEEDEVEARLLSAADSNESDLIELAYQVKAPIEKYYGDGYLETILAEDLSYIQNVNKVEGEPFYSLAYSALKPAQTVQQRLDYFLAFPPDENTQKDLQFIFDNHIPDISGPHIEAYVVNLIAEHLIPIWSLGTLPRFRLGTPLKCPSTQPPFAGLCPIPGKCSGSFPIATHLPSTCWFKLICQKAFHLDAERISTLRSDYSSEEWVVRDGFAKTTSAESAQTRGKFSQTIQQILRRLSS
jgi:hypothetical protein